MSDFEKQIGELNASLKQVGDQNQGQAEQSQHPNRQLRRDEQGKPAPRSTNC
ncbi:major head protein [Pseudomonas aeruginosa]|nr:major head protein [Pseudomonas aeruginosa]